MKTVKCTNCRTETTKQHDGDGCHSCNAGVMRETEDSKNKSFDQCLKDIHDYHVNNNGCGY